MILKFQISGVKKLNAKMRAKQAEFRSSLRDELKIFVEDFYGDLKNHMGKISGLTDFEYTAGAYPVEWEAKRSIQLTSEGYASAKQRAPNFWWWTGQVAKAVNHRLLADLSNEVSWFVGFDQDKMMMVDPRPRKGKRPTAWDKLIWNEFGWTTSTGDEIKRPIYTPLEEKYMADFADVVDEWTEDFAGLLGEARSRPTSTPRRR